MSEQQQQQQNQAVKLTKDTECAGSQRKTLEDRRWLLNREA